MKEWFDPIGNELTQRVEGRRFNRMEFSAGVRVNGTPHIGTYLTLAATFLFAQTAAKHLQVPSSVRIQFLDNDPVVPISGISKRTTHFHCVFQSRTSQESADFIQQNYMSVLDQFRSISGCNFDWEIYSEMQLESEFRSVVLESLKEWKNFKYFVSGPPLETTPTGVRGIGFPCPECGLFNGWVRPSIDFVNDEQAILKTECSDHGEYSAILTTSSQTFLNLETTYRNVIKELLAMKQENCLSIMIKGVDWQDGLRNLNSVLEILGVQKNELVPRFLVPVIKTESGTKLSKSAIQKFPDDFANVPAILLDMNLLRNEIEDYASRIFGMAEKVLSQPKFNTEPVLPSDVLQILTTKKQNN